MSAKSVACNQGRSTQEVCADMPELQGCAPMEPPKDMIPPPIVEEQEQQPQVRIPQLGDPDYVIEEEEQEKEIQQEDVAASEEEEEEDGGGDGGGR
jgi:hypothetical protein